MNGYARRSLGAWAGAAAVVLGGAAVADWFDLSEMGGLLVMGAGIVVLTCGLSLRQFYAKRRR